MSIEITEDNFSQYFYDIRKNKPQKGQVMACYTAIAHFGDGSDKRYVIDLIRQNGKIQAAAQFLKKSAYAAEPDCWSLLKEMVSDLLSGMTIQEVAEKSYRYKLEIFYYTTPECIPANDPHWTTISIANLDQFLDNPQKSSSSEESSTDKEYI